MFEAFVHLKLVCCSLVLFVIHGSFYSMSFAQIVYSFKVSNFIFSSWFLPLKCYIIILKCISGLVCILFDDIFLNLLLRIISFKSIFSIILSLDNPEFKKKKKFPVYSILKYLTISFLHLWKYVKININREL